MLGDEYYYSACHGRAHSLPKLLYAFRKVALL